VQRQVFYFCITVKSEIRYIFHGEYLSRSQTIFEKLRTAALKNQSTHFNIAAIDVTLSIGQKRPFAEGIGIETQRICARICGQET